MKKIESVCVFCGASNAVAPDYLKEAYRLGEMIAERKLKLVFGAGDCGLMGSVANGALSRGGHVSGVFPRILDRHEAEHKTLSELLIVDDMHARKLSMFEQADAFIILPGGFGTMDETFEVITWKQLHTHTKPIIFYNYKNFWRHFISLTEQFVNEGFANPRSRSLYDFASTLDAIFEQLS